MQNQITNLEIQNFKSIKQLQASCKRINLFIGKPNVGKSNILEAISLLGAPYEQNENKYLSSFIRYEDLSNLFYDQELQNKVQVLTNLGIVSLSFDYQKEFYNLTSAEDKATLIAIQTRFKQKIETKPSDFQSKNTYSIKPYYVNIFKDKIDTKLASRPVVIFNPIKKYDFLKLENHKNRFSNFLWPPYGNNLFAIIQNSKNFYKELTSLFKEYGLELVLRIKEQQFEIQKNLDGIVYSYPYSTIADTLQRVIFYLTAIESNTDSVLLFEEPEAHAFPPYTRMLADRIVHSQQNQFFITTHSPYLLHTIIENTPIEELNVFITYFEDYQTKVKALSSEEIRDVLDDSIDIFFNLDRFVAHEA